MAVKEETGMKLSCLSSDTKPTASDYAVGTLLVQTDNHRFYINDGSNWREVSFDNLITYGDIRVGAVLNDVTSSLTLDDTYCFVNVDASGGAVTITLPSVASTTPIGRIYIIKKVDSSVNAVTIAAATGDNIDGNASISLSSQWESYTIVCGGGNTVDTWHIVSHTGSKYRLETAIGVSIGVYASPATIAELNIDAGFYNLVPMTIKATPSGLSTSETATIYIRVTLADGSSVDIASRTTSAGSTTTEVFTPADYDTTKIANNKQVKTIRVLAESSGTTTTATMDASISAEEK